MPDSMLHNSLWRFWKTKPYSQVVSWTAKQVKFHMATTDY